MRAMRLSGNWRGLCLFFPLVLLASLAGCGTARVRPAAEVSVPLPGALLERMARADGQKDTMQAVANIEVRSGKARYPLKIALMVKRPAFLKVEAIPLVGTPDFFLSLREDTLKVFLPQRGEFYICRATPENLSLFLHVSIRREELVSVLMGVPPLTGIAKGMAESPAILERNQYRIDTTGRDGKRQTLWIDRTTGAVIRADVFEDSQLLYSVLYEDYREEDGIPMPGKVVITQDDEEIPGIVIRYSDLRLSPATDTGEFDLPVPPGIEPIVRH